MYPCMYLVQDDFRLSTLSYIATAGAAAVTSLDMVGTYIMNFFYELHDYRYTNYNTSLSQLSRVEPTLTSSSGF